jgi:MFS family permease
MMRWASTGPRMLGTSLGRRQDSGETPVKHPFVPNRLGRALDFVSDLGVLAFAVWTLIAYVGMATQAKATLLVAVWLATVPLLGVILVALASRAHGAMASEPTHRPHPRAAGSQTTIGLSIAGVAAGLVSAILAATVAHAVWVLVWAGAVTAVAVAVIRGRWRSEESRDLEPTPAWPAHAFAACVGLSFAVMSLFVNRPNGDDTFYVNRATGTAQLNRIPVRDIIFTDERINPISGAGLPVDSFSALEGAVGRFVGIHGASVAYYVIPPLVTFFATWALWRLLRAWAPSSVVLCFALGCVYWAFSAQSALTPGSYFLNRIWQGKVVLVAWLIPTAYVLLTRWLSRRDARTAVLLLAVGVSAIGLTGSGTFVAPLVFGTAMVALAARRDWRGFPVLLAAAAFPFLVGFIATQMYSVKLLSDKELSNAWYFHQVFGVGVLAAVSLVGLWAGPWLARSGPPARLTTGISVVALLLLAPALLPTLNDVTQLTSILRRTLWIVPLPALVGLLGAVSASAVLRRLPDAPSLHRWIATAAPAALVAALLIPFGQPLWISWKTGGDYWIDRPAWKIGKRPLRKAWSIIRRYEGQEAILAEEPIMHAIGLITVRPKAVNPRGFYARLAPEPRQRTDNRLALTRFVTGEKPIPSQQEVRRALVDLRVGLICVDDDKALIIREVETIGYLKAFSVRKMVCLRRPQSIATAASFSASTRLPSYAG